METEIILIHTSIQAFISFITNTNITFGNKQLYLYLYLGILTIIRVLIQSLKFCDIYNYMSR